MELFKVNRITEKVLKDNKKARDDDNVLYLAVLELLGISAKTPLTKVFTLVRNGTIPSLQSVSRARRKLQEQFKEYRGTVKATERRAKAEIEYESFYTDWVV